jgi:hypothetical protein
MVHTVQEVIRGSKNELTTIASSYARDEDTIVTELMFNDLKRATFALLPEEIRIRDLEQSPDLQEEITHLFKDRLPEYPGWPYVEQLEEQDRCYVEVGCTFKLGSGLYTAKGCDHYVCQAHKWKTCCAGKTGDSEQDKNKDSKQDKNKDSKQDKNKDSKQDKNKDSKQDKNKDSKPDEDKDSSASEQQSGAKAMEPQQAPIKAKGGNQAEEKREDDKSPTPKQSSSGSDVNEGAKKKRTPKFEVEDIKYFSIADFDFKNEDRMEKQEVCQVRDKKGNLVWMLLDEYVKLKNEHVQRKAEDDEEL